MAVEAQYPSDAFSPDFSGGRSPNDLFEELKMHQFRSHHIGDLSGPLQHLANNGTTVLSDPQSELTCNVAASASRKRSGRDDGGPQSELRNQGIPPGFSYPDHLTFPPAKTAATVPQTSYEQSRMYGSTGTSTSGRASAVSPLAQDIVSHLYHQSMEIDSLLRLQTERLRSGLEHVRKRHCTAMLSAMQQQVVKCLSEKEAELESVVRRSAELEELVRQMSAEKQIWFDVAKKNEAVASSLRAALEQVLVQNPITTAAPQAEEGYGDSEDVVQSCYFKEAETVAVRTVVRREEDVIRRRSGYCRVCEEEEVCVLLLPCRHLCLCKGCESSIDTCPICHSTKNASLQIFMP